MLTDVLTIATSVLCPHGFPVRLSSAAILRVSGHEVVRAADLPSTTFDCAATVNPPCVSITTSIPSATLREGTPVVLATGLVTNIGPCTFPPPPTDLLRTD